MWKKWSHVDGMYIRCHDVNDVTRGSAFKHLNNTDVGRNGSLGFRELYIEDLSSRPSVLFRNPLRISAVFNSTSLEKPIFHWSNVVGKSHDVFLQICSSQQTRTYISTCNLKPIYAVKLLTEPMLIRVTVQDSGIFINVMTILKANSLFSGRNLHGTIQAVFKPYTTITCIFSKSSYEHGLIKFNFITSDFNYDVVINIDACALSQNPIVQNVECTTVGGIKIIQVYLREDRNYLREMYSHCHGVTNVTLGSIYIPIYHKVRNLNGYSGVIIFALCVILTMVNIVILIKYGTLLITRYKGRLSRLDNDNQAYATIIALRQSSAALEADETTFSVESSKYQNIETD